MPFPPQGFQRGGEGGRRRQCHLRAVQWRVPSGSSRLPRSRRRFCSPAGKYTHLRANQETKRKNEELGKMLKPSIIHLGCLLLACLVKTDYDKERERGRAIWGSHPWDRSTCSPERWRSGVKQAARALGFSMLRWVLYRKRAIPLKTSGPLPVSVMTSPGVRIRLFPRRAGCLTVRVCLWVLRWAWLTY